jgi:hypothetical protein
MTVQDLLIALEEFPLDASVKLGSSLFGDIALIVDGKVVLEKKAF